MPSVFFNDTVDAFGKELPTVNLVNINDPNVFEAKLLQDVLPPSTCADFKGSWPNFVKDASLGLHFVEDRRVELIDNSSGNSTQLRRTLNGECLETKRTFVNNDQCVVRSDCGVPVFSGEFVLTAENLRKFYEVDGKFVYRMQGLPLIGTVSPCDTKYNRFVRKNADKDSGGCSFDGNRNTTESEGIIADKIGAFLSALSSPVEQSSVRVIDMNTEMGCVDPEDDALGSSFSVIMPDNITSRYVDVL